MLKNTAYIVGIAIMYLAGTATAGPVGPEFQVNTYTTDIQCNTSAAMSALGTFVVAWMSVGQDADGGGVYAQRYDASGTPQGGEFQVNTYTTSNQWYPSVDMDASGNFVVAWQSNGQDGDGSGVYAQRYDAAGAPQGAEFQVNTYTTSDQETPYVAMGSSGNFVVVWQSAGQDGDSYGVYAQRYDASGTPQGGEFLVNTYTMYAQAQPCVAIDGADNFVVAWTGDALDGDATGIFAQRYDASGTPQGGEFQVNTYTWGVQDAQRIGMDASGNFVVAWESYDFGYDVFAQRYDGAGTPQGAEFRVNTYTEFWQGRPSVGMDASGNFVVAWETGAQDGDAYGIYAQGYDSSGVAQGGEFQVNTYTTSDQIGSSVGFNGFGNFVIAWDSEGQDGDGWGIYAQRYGPPRVDTIQRLMSSPTQGGTLGFAVTFSEPVTGVAVSDFALFTTGAVVGATIAGVTGSGSDYTVTVENVSGEGTLRLDVIDDDSIVDSLSAPLGDVGTGNGDFTTGEVYTVCLQLPLAAWPVALVLLTLGAAAMRSRGK